MVATTIKSAWWLLWRPVEEEKRCVLEMSSRKEQDTQNRLCVTALLSGKGQGATRWKRRKAIETICGTVNLVPTITALLDSSLCATNAKRLSNYIMFSLHRIISIKLLSLSVSFQFRAIPLLPWFLFSDNCRIPFAWDLHFTHVLLLISGQFLLYNDSKIHVTWRKIYCLEIVTSIDFLLDEFGFPATTAAYFTEIPWNRWNSYLNSCIDLQEMLQ